MPALIGMNVGFVNAIPQVTREVFDAIGFDPAFHQQTRINSDPKAEVQDTAGTSCCLHVFLISTGKYP